MKLPEPLYFVTFREDGMRQDNPYYTADQLKQAIRDALEQAAKEVDFEAFPSERARFGVAADTIRAMIKDIL